MLTPYENLTSALDVLKSALADVDSAMERVQRVDGRTFQAEYPAWAPSFEELASDLSAWADAETQSIQRTVEQIKRNYLD